MKLSGIGILMGVMSVIVGVCYVNIPTIIQFLSDTLKNSSLSPAENGERKEERCLKYIHSIAEKGNATSVLNAIDKFGWEDTFLMNIGDVKGKILTRELMKKSPKMVLEVGAYIGYSAVRISSQIPNDSRLISVELSPTNLNYAQQTVNLAGLSNRVTFVEGTVTSALKSYLLKENIDGFDFIFLDHNKYFYLSDLKYLLAEKLLKPGAVVVADNVLLPGAPDYWFHMVFDSRFQTTSYLSQIEYLPLPDVVTVSYFLGY